MRITPRKTEVSAVAALLEKDGYATAEALAKDIIKTVAAEFAKREWYCAAHRFGPGEMVVAWGPLTSDIESAGFAKKAGIGGEWLSVKLYSTASMLDRLAEMGKPRSTHCANPECGHLHGLHEHPGFSGRCCVRGCPCKDDVK